MRELTKQEEKALEIINIECENSKSGAVFRPYIEKIIKERLGENVKASSLVENLIYLGKVVPISYSGKYIKAVE